MNNEENKSTPQESQDKQSNQATSNEINHEEQSAQPQTEQEQEQEQVQEEINHEANDQSTENTWHNKNVLKRGVAMLGFGFVGGFVRLAITLIAIFQFISLLMTEKPNQPLVLFGQNLNTYLYQINQFLTVNAETYPFPFADWPDSAPKQ